MTNKKRSYEFSVKGLEQAKADRRNELERNKLIAGLCVAIPFAMFVSLVNPIAGFSTVAFVYL